MSVQLSRNIKIFLTSNLTSTGAIETSGFTADNTTEIVIVDQSFSFQQAKSFTYISNTAALDQQSQIDIRSTPAKEMGVLSFGTTLNSSSTGPFDAKLWNALVNNARYPVTGWTIGSSSHELNIARQTQKTIAIGIIVLVDGVAYLFDNVRVETLSLSLAVDQISTAKWDCLFSSYRVVASTYSENSGTTTFSGSLSGTCNTLTYNNYTWGGSKLSMVTISKLEDLEPVNLAAVDLSFSISNTHTYIPDIGLDRTELGSFYSDAGSEVLQGSVRVYSKAIGTASQGLMQEIRGQANNPYSTELYNVELKIFSAVQVNLLDIKLYNCSIEALTQTDGMFTDTFNFRVVDGLQAQNCFVKFYT